MKQIGSQRVNTGRWGKIYMQQELGHCYVKPDIRFCHNSVRNASIVLPNGHWNIESRSWRTDCVFIEMMVVSVMLTWEPTSKMKLTTTHRMTHGAVVSSEITLSLFMERILN